MLRSHDPLSVLFMYGFAKSARALRNVTTGLESMLRPLGAMWASDPAALEDAFDLLDKFVGGLDAAAANGFEPGQYGPDFTIVGSSEEHAELQAARTPHTHALSTLVTDTSPAMQGSASARTRTTE